MENRRHAYRHTFSRPQGRRVELTHDPTNAFLNGEMVNLSLGGMAIQFDDPARSLRPRDRYRVRFLLESDEAIALSAEVVHGTSEATATCGLQFLSPVDLVAAEARERKLWHFLLTEQCRLRSRGA